MFELKKIILFSCILILASCFNKNLKYITIDNTKFINVKSLGAKGDGTEDDRAAIQQAFDVGENVYFPKGKYLLESKTITEAILSISERNSARHILFEKGAELVVSQNQPTDYIKPAVILVSANKGSIKSMIIDGLAINGNRSLHKIKNTGLTIYERKGAAIHKVQLKNIVIRNAGGNGIHTQARFNNFQNIITENCGVHGIGVVNNTNKGIINEFYLDGYTSTNDDAYSIDFSGPKDKKNVGYAYPGYEWKGEVKNVISKNAKHGIKTAGYWNLKMKDILIENSRGNGFFINVDAPSKTLELENFTVINAANNGLNLQGETMLKGKNIKVIGCGLAIKAVRTNADIDGLIVESTKKGQKGIRIGKHVDNLIFNNFKVFGFDSEEQYPLRLKSKNLSLSNGTIENNESLYEVLIYDTVDKATIDNLKLNGNSNSKVISNGILNEQKTGSLEIKNSDFTKIRGKALVDKNKKSSVVKSKGF